MKEERAQILEMLQKGKITVDEADMLLGALGETAVSSQTSIPSVSPVPPVPPVPFVPPVPPVPPDRLPGTPE